MALVVCLNLVGGCKSSLGSVRRSLVGAGPYPPMREDVEVNVMGQTATKDMGSCVGALTAARARWAR